MGQLANLKAAGSLTDLANLLQFKPSAVSYILYRLSSKYKQFEIPKRRGGKRAIKAPAPKLKLLQQKLSLLLQDCLDEINAAKQRKDMISHGFKRQRSIITNAWQHRHRRHVFNIDLQDFFPSINFGRVRGFFINDTNFCLDPAVATVIAQIACDDNSLPQGSPCSPVISNLIAHIMDMQIFRLAATAGCTYSRYADDLTFSTNKRQFPPGIAQQDSTDPHIWKPGAALLRKIGRGGFQINPAKTRMQYRTSRQEVTGLVVNEKINIRSEYRQEVRAMVHRLFTKGEFTIFGPVTKDGVVTLEHRAGTLDELHGRLGFIDTIDSHDKDKKQTMYRRFLSYKDFYMAERPVIICEGKTDIVYLRHAIRSLAAQFPYLADINQQGAMSSKVRLYNYPQSSTGRILGLAKGGNALIANFIGTYKSDTERFQAVGQKQPVIILYDNDDGAPKIRSAIQTITKNKLDGTEAYTHVARNLYAMPTPLPTGGKESKIEDFFDASTLANVIAGKKFHPDSNGFDKTKHYGKHIFADQVVKVKAGTINFDGFKPLLSILETIIRDHATMLSSEPTTVITPAPTRTGL